MASPAGHVNIEVVSGNYRAADIAAKAAAGFQMHGEREPARSVAHRQCSTTGPVGESGRWRWRGRRATRQGIHRTMKPIFVGIGITAAPGRPGCSFTRAAARLSLALVGHDPSRLLANAQPSRGRPPSSPASWCSTRWRVSWAWPILGSGLDLVERGIRPGLRGRGPSTCSRTER